MWKIANFQESCIRGNCAGLGQSRPIVNPLMQQRMKLEQKYINSKVTFKETSKMILGSQNRNPTKTR